MITIFIWIYIINSYICQMKKLITLFTLLFLTLTTIAQTSHARAYQFLIGYRDFSTNEIVWNGTPTTCNILIEIKDNDVVIYSKTKQHYHVIAKLNETSDGVQYRMSDENGIKCNFYMGPIAGSESVYIAIEYNDYAWMYSCVDE